MGEKAMIGAFVDVHVDRCRLRAQHPFQFPNIGDLDMAVCRTGMNLNGRAGAEFEEASGGRTPKCTFRTLNGRPDP
jgi:hypothetical protein